ncbi:MAG TPA: 2-C-methyl-D-erythritol 2,4-cyclodiphosphate synthase, partial [Spirochaetota bacterium]|nr:2-C-methyl-D-erythritol 2,4-cyclodiphosphate synthase [Spirochaetota bacterium]
TEKLGFTGRSEGIAVHAVALLQLQQNTASRM